MRKIVVIHQPDFAPYMGFFHRFLHADLYIALDHVQFVSNTSRSWMHRDKIKTSTGEKWMTLSVKKMHRETPINQIELSDGVDWQERNLNLLRQNYRKATFFDEIMPQVEKMYSLSSGSLANFNLLSIDMLSDMFDVVTPRVLSSSLDPQGSKNEMLIDLLLKVGATHYISGIGAKEYMRQDLFELAGIELIWQDFKHPTYFQMFGEFIPYLSSLDVMFNCGVKGARKTLRSAL